MNYGAVSVAVAVAQQGGDVLVAAELLASLDGPADDDPETVRAQWRDELERRATSDGRSGC